jgi:membrane-associated phospholipid phosphatase
MEFTAATLADWIARHALLVLSCMTLLALIGTACLWWLIESYGGALWATGVRVWNFARRSWLAQRLRRTPGLNTLLTHTLTAGRYLGVHAVLSFAVAAFALVAFFELAGEIGLDEDLAHFDLALSEALSRHLSMEVLRTMAWITHLGDRNFLLAIGVIVAAVLFLKRERLLACAWMIATASGGLLNTLLKAIFVRTRPIHEHGIVSEDGWSFPSGHASGSMLIYGLLGYLAVRLAPKPWRLPAAVVAVALIVFVGSSRVLLQVHYLSDVLAGYASAAAWASLCVAGLEAARLQRQAAPVSY